MATATMSLPAAESLRRTRRKGSYHLVASRNRLPTDEEEEEEDILFQYLVAVQPGSAVAQPWTVQEAKRQLLRELAQSQGDWTVPGFQEKMEKLSEWFTQSSHFDARKKPSKKHSSQKHLRPKEPELEGMWISLSRPQFPGCLGVNKDNEFMYSLGRMSFDMFLPTQLVCSIQGTFNPVHELDSKKVLKMDCVPKVLKKEMQEGNCVLRTYDIVTAFTIEPHNPALFGPDSPNRFVDHPIKGLMTTYGYALSNPEEPYRVSIWFTGGCIEALDDCEEWMTLFGNGSLPRRKLKEHTNVLGAKLLLGAEVPGRMEEDGKMSYRLHRPAGGHDKAFIDVLYLDETFRVVRANRGVHHIFARVPVFPDE